MPKKVWLFVLGVAVGAVPTYVGWNREVRELQSITKPLADKSAKLERDNQDLRLALGDGTSLRYDRQALSTCMMTGANRATAIGAYARGAAMVPQEAAAFEPLRSIVVRNRDAGASRILELLVAESARLGDACIDASRVNTPPLPK
ncbi:hypothetical protein FXN63_14190 [Pigmentiphaga aceris]|uniref:Uncharacterized protein n=1 Tax=Pigmentiphaga aceris TaxID=1940612 RepID=A0A5C0AYR7_9BURK|nr:hypothetical protein [Pigmentiphaga aceris]QEI06856.1 hypothetical protein FXN63_14190 [Pigmentiphaga aceris]